MNVAGKHVVVTGGGTGVGAATAKAFAAAGATVTIMGRTQQTLEAQGLPFALCDVTDRTAVATAFEAASLARGPIAIVVANAGTAQSMPFAKLTTDHLADMLGVNLIGVANVWQAAFPGMKAAGWGRLMAIASTAGLKGYAYVSAYCAAKHAVVGFTRALAVELAQTGVTVNAICPGFVDTPLLARAVDNIAAVTGVSTDDAAVALKANNPQRRFIDAGEVAAAALWLASEEARSVSGHALSLSGGEV